MAAKYWENLDETRQGAAVSISSDELWEAYRLNQTPPDEIIEPVMPAARTLETLRQYQSDTREYRSLKEKANGNGKEPTERRILDYAQMLAWKEDGSERLDVDSAVLNEDIIIVRKPAVQGGKRL
jgi:hypothetical protein